VRQISRTRRRRTGEAKAEVLRLNERAGRLIRRSATEARGLAAAARRAARGRGARANLEAAQSRRNSRRVASEWPSKSQERARGEKTRPAGVDRRPGRASDPQGQARQADRVRLRRAAQRADRGHQAGGAGLILPPQTAPSKPGREHSLPQTAAELEALGLCPREIALDGSFGRRLSAEQLADIAPERIFVAGRSDRGSRRTRRRLARYRVGMERRISHLKRR
jgi:hypothetical protein